MQPLPAGAIDLSALRQRAEARADFSKATAITVQPGDKIFVVLPKEVTAQDTEMFANFLKQQFSEADFVVVSGPEYIVRVPAGLQQSEAPQGGTDAMVETPVG